METDTTVTFILSGAYFLTAALLAGMGWRIARENNWTVALLMGIAALVLFGLGNLLEGILPSLVSWPQSWRWAILSLSALAYLLMAVSLILLTWKGVRILRLPAHSGQAHSVPISILYLLLVFILVAVPELSMRGDRIAVRSLLLVQTLSQCILVTLCMRWFVCSWFCAMGIRPLMRWLSLSGLMIVLADNSERFFSLLYIDKTDFWSIQLQILAFAMMWYVGLNRFFAQSKLSD